MHFIFCDETNDDTIGIDSISKDDALEELKKMRSNFSDYELIDTVTT